MFGCVASNRVSDMMRRGHGNVVYNIHDVVDFTAFVSRFDAKRFRHCSTAVCLSRSMDEMRTVFNITWMHIFSNVFERKIFTATPDAFIRCRTLKYTPPTVLRLSAHSSDGHIT